MAKGKQSVSSKWTRETLIALFERNDKVGFVAVERALVAIYDRQTAAEKAAEETVEQNGVGFAGNDAKTGTWLVETVIAQAKFKGFGEGYRLRGKAFAMALRIVKRYAGTQLLQIARAKEAEQKIADEAANAPVITINFTAADIAAEKAQFAAAIADTYSPYEGAKLTIEEKAYLAGQSVGEYSDGEYGEPLNEEMPSFRKVG